MVLLYTPQPVTYAHTSKTGYVTQSLKCQYKYFAALMLEYLIWQYKCSTNNKLYGVTMCTCKDYIPLIFLFSQGKPSPRKELLHNIDILYPKIGAPMFTDTFDTRIRAALRVGDWKIITGNPGLFTYTLTLMGGDARDYYRISKCLFLIYSTLKIMEFFLFF